MHWLDALFSEVGIEVYGALSIEDADIINARLLERECFTPRSILIFLVPYYAGECVNLSRYAAAKDYHIALKQITSRLIEGIKEKYPEASAKGYGDHSPIAERSAALRAGLGILGDNGLIINEKYGSYVFIGDVITDLPPDLLFAKPTEKIRTCSHCGRCKAACPSGILRGEGEDCLSAITQRKGSLTDAEIALMKKYNTVWGCDECQKVCPYNINAEKTTIEDFIKSANPRVTEETPIEGRAFSWRGEKVIKRNLRTVSNEF